MCFRNIHIRAEGLAAGFGDRLLFRELNLTVAAGEFILIRGENGSGKTTLIKTILGLLPPRAGRVFLMGAAVGGREWRKVRRRAAYVNQHAVLSDFPIAAREVVEIGTAALGLNRREKKSLVEEAMRLTNCLALGDSPYAVLSGGEKQRVSIARCLAQRADLLLLDEPASHLDRRAKLDLVEIITRLNREKGITVVLVSHEHHDTIEAESGVRRLTLGNGVAAHDTEADR